MFDTTKVAKKIREARIAKNMTQMNLADAMGVSYQAVSNWERGNSMPDISKLEDLCRVLSISVSDLLGMENRETAAVEKVLSNPEQPLSVEELSGIAPMLPPAEIKEQARKTAGDTQRKWSIHDLAEIAVFLDDDLLEELIGQAQVESLKELEELAPLLDDELLEKLVRQAPADDYAGIVALAPFLNDELLDELVARCHGKPDKKLLGDLLPFLGEESMAKLALRCAEETDLETLENMAPFLDGRVLDAIVDTFLKQGKTMELSELYPFLESDTLRRIAKALMARGDLEGLKKAAVFL